MIRSGLLPIPVILIALGLLAIAVSVILALIGGVNLDLNAILGAGALVVGALLVGVVALLSYGE